MIEEKKGIFRFQKLGKILYGEKLNKLQSDYEYINIINNNFYQEKMRKRFNYETEFQQVSKTQKVQFPRRMRRKYVSQDENQLPYRNCIARYQNAYHFGLKAQLKQNQRNIMYLRSIRNEKQQQKIDEPLSQNINCNNVKKKLVIDKIHTISQHCQDDQMQTIVIDENDFNTDILY